MSTNNTPMQSPDTNAVAKPNDERPNLPLALGRVYMTAAAKNLSLIEVIFAMGKHRQGDWGKVSIEDHDANNRALVLGERVMSVYTTHDGVEFWIITEGDRSATTVLLPEEY